MSRRSDDKRMVDRSNDPNIAARNTAPHTGLGKAFLHHDRELGVKVSATLQLWYEQIFVPLEQRIAWLEKPWPVRWYLLWKKPADEVVRMVKDRFFPEKLPEAPELETLAADLGLEEAP